MTHLPAPGSPGPHSALEESTREDSPWTLSRTSRARAPPGCWVSREHRLVWGGGGSLRVPPGAGLPLALHLTEAEQGWECGGHGVSSLWSRLCSWRRARRPQDTQTAGCGPLEAGPPCHRAVTSEAPQEGELPLPESLALVSMTNLVPLPGSGDQGMSSLSEPPLGVSFLLCPSISTSLWLLRVDRGHPSWRCFR